MTSMPLDLSLTAFSWQDFFLPLILFSFSMSATPGPNNVMLTASGARFGYRGSLRHMLGISFGFFTLITVIALGLGMVFQRWPAAQQALAVVGIIYLLFLAWKIGTAPPPDCRPGTTGRSASGRLRPSSMPIPRPG